MRPASTTGINAVTGALVEAAAGKQPLVISDYFLPVVADAALHLSPGRSSRSLGRLKWARKRT
jgi:hypothetical protein